VQYLAELDVLRDQLQQQVSRSSRLEGENRQLHKQLGELKADKAAADAALQVTDTSSGYSGYLGI
jgi:regulator of replication initiation timing